MQNYLLVRQTSRACRLAGPSCISISVEVATELLGLLGLLLLSDHHTAAEGDVGRLLGAAARIVGGSGVTPGVTLARYAKNVFFGGV